MSEHTTIQNDDRFVNRIRVFEERIAILQDAYAYWFEMRRTPTNPAANDGIQNYYRYYLDSNNNIALYVKDTLHLEIRLECTTAFNDIFPS
ncbi:hypothetical protein OQY15_04515 [Pedobacter sp. MC2016-15]|uniref:hypothetical protein n=1 Tax=Pedobacter sp. MC2016-15 TaxID=2994473 RepID=UPI002246A2EC|nr:hypothetical protein [Pedobacter sp. MC2016-15]MCX2478340.1 hypothetical protein [Pedobacter sp. MC2016-15]